MRYFKIILSLIINFTNSLQFFVGFLEMGEYFPEQCFSFPNDLTYRLCVMFLRIYHQALSTALSPGL